jgi:phage major head subunit gpT-like protein
MSYNADLDRGLANINTFYKVMSEDLFGAQLPGSYQLFTDTMPTNALNTEIDWVGETPMMKKWVGPRERKGMRAYLHSVKLAKYATGIPIDRMTVAYGASGAVQKRLGQFLQEQAQVYQQLAMTELLSNPTGYDGVSIFSASHPFAYGASTFSNYTTNALTRANYNTARAAMQVYRTERGRYWTIMPDTILVGPALEEPAKELFSATRAVALDESGSEATQFAVTSSAIPNVWQGELKVVVDPQITGSTYQYYWFLLDTKRPSIKPVIIVEGRKPVAIPRTDMDDPHRYDYDEFLYGVEGDFAAAAGFWQTAYGALSTTAP